MIILAGDTHGSFEILKSFAENDEGRGLTKADVVIVLGDFGVWEYSLEEIKSLDALLPYTLAFLDGNHENFPLLYSMPEREMFGGRVHDLGGVYHLCRGETYVFPDKQGEKTVAVCGGGFSRDRDRRTKGVSWFPEEEITDTDVERALESLKKHGGRVDAFLSHVPSSEVKLELFAQASFSMNKPALEYIPHASEYKIRDLIGRMDVKLCFAGHEHLDKTITASGRHHRLVYNDFVKL